MSVKQVGGDHYLAEYQHWDWVFDIHMGYLEACATKYVTRWRKKNGIQDLEKAKSYIAKLISQCEGDIQPINRSRTDIPEALLIGHNSRFFHNNKIEDDEANICTMLAAWDDISMLQEAILYIDELIASAQGAATLQALGVAGVAPPQATTAPDGTLSQPQAAFKVGDAVYYKPQPSDDNTFRKILRGKRGVIKGLRHVPQIGEVAEVQYVMEGESFLRDLETADLGHYRDTIAMRPGTEHPAPFGYEGDDK